jgi:pseudaminic acid synthase
MQTEFVMPVAATKNTLHCHAKSPGPDSSFSLEPHEFRVMADVIRVVEKSLGKVNYELTEKEEPSKCFRRSLFIVKDVKQGEVFTTQNIRSIRPGYGLPPKYIDAIVGHVACRDFPAGTPVTWGLLRSF